MAIHLLAHDQVGAVDVVHLLTDTPHPVLQPQHHPPQVTIRHAVHRVNGLALGIRHYFGVTINVGDLLDFDLHSWGWMWRGGKNHRIRNKISILKFYSVSAFLTHITSYQVPLS